MEWEDLLLKFEGGSDELHKRDLRPASLLEATFSCARNSTVGWVSFRTVPS